MIHRYFIIFFIIFHCVILYEMRVEAFPRVKSAILYNMSTGKILYQMRPNQPVAPASLTKLMTMFLAMDAIKSKKLSYKQKLVITPEAAKVGGSTMSLAAGEKLPVVRLLSGMAVSSGNDAAMAIAAKVGGNTANFINLMNKKAKKLGMKNTVFKNPTGMPAAGQKTTAYDLLLLCRAYLSSHPEATRFHKILYFLHRGKAARNTNPLLGSISGVDGLKTGWTVASGYNLIVTAKRGKTRLLAIILGGFSKKDREEMAIRLIEAGFKFPASQQQASRFIESR